MSHSLLGLLNMSRKAIRFSSVQLSDLQILHSHYNTLASVFRVKRGFHTISVTGKRPEFFTVTFIECNVKSVKRICQ